VDQADNIGFGKAAPGQSYMALYAVAQIGGVRGVFRSDDAGASWVRINDDQHQYGNIGGAITGDPRIYGRVYLGTNGRGVLYADRLGGSSTSPTASASASPSASRSASASPSASASASRSASASPSASPSPTVSTTGAAGGCNVAYTVTGQWAGGFQGDVKITNTGGTAINGWTLKWTYANGQVITQLWNGTVAQSGAAVTVTNVAYNGTLAAGGGNADVGFLANWNNTTNAKPAAFTLNGSSCAVS
jgi:hypothetical protein